MEWIKQNNFFIGTLLVEIRSIKVPNENGTSRRLRISTVGQNPSLFTKIPAEGRLFKSDKGQIGVFISGKNSSAIKVGSNYAIQQNLIVALNTLSKKPLQKLLKNTRVELIEIDGTIVGIEK